ASVGLLFHQLNSSVPIFKPSFAATSKEDKGFVNSNGCVPIPSGLLLVPPPAWLPAVVSFPPGHPPLH
ncbi:MAG: hypothetical protein NWQ07_02440, partial [Flaviramulus sp.]|nr:hypothetical protein [Flaviramulus sp.]